MDTAPELLMSFASLDEAESALDWIGVDFGEADGAFEGVLTADDGELLDEVVDDPETPAPVRELAAALRRLLDAAGPDAQIAWRVTFEA
jgi:hypothetical protein